MTDIDAPLLPTADAPTPGIRASLPLLARQVWGRAPRARLALPVGAASLAAGILCAAVLSQGSAVASTVGQGGKIVASATPVEISARVETTMVQTTIEESLAPSAIQQDDPTLAEGLSRVISSGQPGWGAVTYEVTYVQGVQVARTVAETVVLTPALDDVVAIGTLDVPDRPAIEAGSTREIGKQMASDVGWTGVEWSCLDNLWARESNWRTEADNPSSSAFGIPQALPGSKMAAFGDDWETNPATQIAWGLSYISGRYGTPCQAWQSFSLRSPHWY